jgi:two-component system sensor histidine kinase HydH
MHWVFLLVGIFLGAAAAALLMGYRTRRAIRIARQARRHQRDKDHLLDLAQLTGGLAHEIRNPLSTIKLNLKLLAEDFQGGDDELHRRNFNRLQRLEDEVQRLQDTLDDFLKFAGHQELHGARIDLRNVVEELIDFFRPQAEGGRVVLRGSIPHEPVLCDADAAMIKQAVLNLMINALQAMAGGGELLLRLGRQGDQAILEVIDTGPGIPADKRGRIFDPYYSSRPGGSGLGLPTTRRIVERHGGEIAVDGEPGKGTRFVVALPAVDGA